MTRNYFIAGAFVLTTACGILGFAAPAMAATANCYANVPVVGKHTASTATTAETQGLCGLVAVQSGYRPTSSAPVYYLAATFNSTIAYQGKVSGYTTIQGKHWVTKPSLAFASGFPFYS